MSTFYPWLFRTPKYWNWFLNADLTHTYKLLRWQLKYLQVSGSQDWWNGLNII